MEKNEPSLIPEWLKNSGSSGSSSSARSDDGLTRNRYSVNNTAISNNYSNYHNSGNANGRDFWRSFRSERTSSNSKGPDDLRSQSSSGGRNHHDKEWSSSSRYEANSKEKSFLGERWHRDSPGSFKSTSLTKLDRDGLRRSQSMISGRRGDTWHKKAAKDSDYYGGRSKNGSPTKTNSPISGPKMNFSRDFPSLGSEERGAALDVTRVPSPGFSSSIKTLITSNVGNEKWKSALAEVPGLVGGNGIKGSSSSQHVALGTNTGLNMAEAVAQGPIHAQSAPQLSVGTQKSDELSLKLSKQLIPVTPSLPKSLTKAGQQQHVVLANNSPRGGPVKSEAPKAKLHILKPAREKNGVAPPISSPTGSNKPVTPTLLAPCSSSSSSVQSPPIIDPKTAITVLEKRPTSQARSRKDFFNSVRKKSMENNSSATAESPPSLPESSIATLNMGDHVSSEEKVELKCNGDAKDHHHNNGDEQSTTWDLSVPDEAEAAFLRSLGWEEDSDEGGLTEEEIKAFFRDAAAKHNIDSKPTLKALQRSTTGNAF